MPSLPGQEGGFLLNTPNFGFAAFTVPKFEAFLKRSVELSVPPKRVRRGSGG